MTLPDIHCTTTDVDAVDGRGRGDDCGKMAAVGLRDGNTSFATDLVIGHT